MHNKLLILLFIIFLILPLIISPFTDLQLWKKKKSY